MAAPHPTDLAAPSCQGLFNYLQPSTPSSLLRNGCVKITRDPQGNTSSSAGINLQAYTVEVHNARLLAAAQQPTCDRNGFELRTRPLADTQVDFHDHAGVVNSYYAECAGIVADLTGAHAYAFDHNVRSAGGKQAQKKLSGGQDVQPPAHIVHGDYTLRSGPERLQQLRLPPSGNDTLRGWLPPGESLLPADLPDRPLQRFSIINIWRSIDTHPVASHPLALCDGQTVNPEDLVVFEIHYPDRVGENYFAKFSPQHRLYYYPQMTRDEILVIKQWDSAGNLARSDGKAADASAANRPCTFSFHSAFDDPQSRADARDRWSIEVRCMVLYD